MYEGEGISDKADIIGRSLDKHSDEIEAIERKLNNPKLSSKERARLIERASAVRIKIRQLFGRLQIA